jgi:hypothetical protein
MIPAGTHIILKRQQNFYAGHPTRKSFLRIGEGTVGIVERAGAEQGVYVVSFPLVQNIDIVMDIPETHFDALRQQVKP